MQSLGIPKHLTNQNRDQYFGRMHAQAPEGQVQPKHVQNEVKSLLAHYPGCQCGAHDVTTMTPDRILEKIKADSYAHIIAHEQAHASAAGHLGGAIALETDSNGVVVAGHVPITIPGLSPANPESNIDDYNTVRAAALAPGDPSSADKSIASTASALLGMAQVLMQNKQNALNIGLTVDQYIQAGKPKTIPDKDLTPIVIA
ncbi:MAG: putative metalloprotease CJM1_0395 family protein [Cyanobacteria bacterium P01_H01_bin.74]